MTESNPFLTDEWKNLPRKTREVRLEADGTPWRSTRAPKRVGRARSRLKPDTTIVKCVRPYVVSGFSRTHEFGQAEVQNLYPAPQS